MQYSVPTKAHLGERSFKYLGPRFVGANVVARNHRVERKTVECDRCLQVDAIDVRHHNCRHH